MASSASDRVREEAIGWHVRLDHATDEDWDAFTRWLEADPSHNAMYEAVCDADLALDPAVERIRLAPVVVADEAEAYALAAQPRRRRWMWPAMAASVALVAAGTWVMTGGLESEYTVRTAPGETRTLALGDGTRIALNGGSQIVLDKSNPRSAELKSGEAQFMVRHDAQDPFTLTVGDQRIVDVGTVFNVRRSPRGVRVEVADGAVRFEDGETHLRLGRGDVLDVAGDTIVESTRAPGDIGAWTRGRLVYRDAGLMEVAADLTRARGMAVELGPNLADRRFTGVIQLVGDDATLQKRVSTLLGVKVAATSDGWSLSQ